MTAYSLFFRDTQASIKAQNQQASFGEVSRIVASMWDSLEPHEKQVCSLLRLHSSIIIQVYLIKCKIASAGLRD